MLDEATLDDTETGGLGAGFVGAAAIGAGFIGAGFIAAGATGGVGVETTSTAGTGAEVCTGPVGWGWPIWAGFTFPSSVVTTWATGTCAPPGIRK